MDFYWNECQIISSYAKKNVLGNNMPFYSFFPKKSAQVTSMVKIDNKQIILDRIINE